MQVCFLSSNFKGHTVPYVAAVSIMAAIDYKLNVLVSHTDVEQNALERVFLKSGNDTSMIAFNDIGLDAVDRLARNSRLHEIQIKDYTIELIKERLDILTGSSKTEYKSFDTEILLAIYDTIKKQYDVNFINISGDLSNRFNQEIIEKSDVVVTCINQNLWMLKEYFNNQSEIRKMIEKKKHIYVMGNYDKDSKYNANNVRRKFKLKSKIHTIPYNISYFDALNDSKAIDFVMKNKNARKGDLNFEFTKGLEEVTKKILNETGIDTKVKQISSKEE